MEEEEIKEMTTEEAVETVKEIGLRYDAQLRIAEAKARADRQREILGETQKPDNGS